MVESAFAPRTLWGTTTLAFAPRPLWVLPWLVPLAPLLARFLPAPGAGPRWRALLPWAAGAMATAIFWLARERHLFWGDANALAVMLPRGQAFHPDEPLTLWLHHALATLTAGALSPTQAVALGSALSGGVFVAIAVASFARRFSSDATLGLLAAATLATQGFTALFYGHVENYAYVCVAMLATLLLAADFLDGRRGPLPAVLAALLAFALHVLGGMLLLPIAGMLAIGLSRPGKRRAAVVATGVLLAAAVLGSLAVRGLYVNGGPFVQLLSAPVRVLTNPRDAHAAVWLSSRQVANVWSHLQLMGPLGLVALAVSVPLLARRRGPPSHAFLAWSALLLYGPIVLVGEGNLGAARNWDLFAAPAVAPALAAIVWMGERLSPAAARRVLLAFLAASLAHLLPWLAVNTRPARIEARIAALPLPGGRAPMMLGTDHLNRGELPEAEGAFREALALEPTNPNAQSGLGLALARQGRFAEAEAPLLAAVQLKPEVPQLRYDLIALYVQLARWHDAERQLADAIALAPAEPRNWQTLAECQFQMGHPDTAAYVLENATSRLPTDASLKAALADAYVRWLEMAERSGDVRPAREAYQKLAQLFPEDPRRQRWQAAFAR